MHTLLDSFRFHCETSCVVFSSLQIATGFADKYAKGTSLTLVGLLDADQINVSINRKEKKLSLEKSALLGVKWN